MALDDVLDSMDTGERGQQTKPLVCRATILVGSVALTACFDSGASFTLMGKPAYDRIVGNEDGREHV